MGAGKRGREESADERGSGGSAASSKRGRGAARGKIDFVECTICGQACPCSSKLTIHMRTHSGDCPYACTTCGQTFSDASNLTRHMRTHSGDRPYACTTCGQAFSDSSNLTVHMRTHSGDRPYACVIK